MTFLEVVLLVLVALMFAVVPIGNALIKFYRGRGDEPKAKWLEGAIPLAIGAMRTARVIGTAIVTRNVSELVSLTDEDETPKPSPPPRPPTFPFATMLLVLALGVTGCTAAYRTAVDVANAGAQVGSAAAPILTERCVEPMRAAAAAHDVDAGRAIAKRCDIPIAAYDELRVAHVALRAVTVALLSGQAPAVVQLISAVVAASTKLGDSIGGLR